MERKEISQAVIQRLPRYYRYLEDLMEQGTDRISSLELSKRMHLTASQIRQDLNNFGGFGQQGYGYNVKNLHEEIGKILNIDREHPMIIVGAKRGFVLRGIFDSNSELWGEKVGELKISPMEEIESVVKEYQIRLAAICIPKDAAVSVAEKLISYGIDGLWNFAHVDLEVPEHVVTENVHLSESLMRLSYRVFEERS